VRVAFVFLFLTVTSAPAIAAPEESKTCPTIWPPVAVDCAHMTPWKQQRLASSMIADTANRPNDAQGSRLAELFMTKFLLKKLVSMRF
jgi:hypothetical protein